MKIDPALVDIIKAQKAQELSQRNFLTLKHFTPTEIHALLDLSHVTRMEVRRGLPVKFHSGKKIALLFQKDSTRTRCAFEVAARDLGMDVTYIGPSGSQMGKKESIKDTARVLGRYYDGIQFRGHRHEDVEILAQYAGVPVWNGLTDLYHPTQVMADFMTIRDRFGTLKDIRMAYVGDARNNVANSLLIGAAKMGMNFTIVAPKELWPDPELVAYCQEEATLNDAQLHFTDNMQEGTLNQEVIYTDVWVSMGEPDEVWRDRIALLHPYQVTKKIMRKCSKRAIFLHCLPAFHGLDTEVGRDIAEKFGATFPAVAQGELEVTNEVFESDWSKVFDQAENRLHTIRAIMLATLKKSENYGWE